MVVWHSAITTVVQSSIFNLRRYRLNFALRYSSPRVNSSSSVFFSLVILCQLTVYIKKNSKINYWEKTIEMQLSVPSFLRISLSSQ